MPNLRGSLGRSLRLAALVLGFGLGAGGASADDEGSLRYRWQAGEEHAFKVSIKIDTDDSVDTLLGQPSYQVVSSDDDGIKLQFHGGVTTSSAPKSPARGFPRTPFPPSPRRSPFGPGDAVGARTLTINDRGRVVAEEGSSQLPYLLGDLALLPFMPLPKSDEKTWTMQRETTISVQQNSEFRHPFFDRREVRNVKAEEESVYTITGREGDIVTVKESYSLLTLEKVRKKPAMEIVGEATVLFDTKLGGPTSYESELSLVLREGNSTMEVPITVSMKRIDPVELANSRKAAAEAAAQAKAAADAEMRKPLEPGEVSALIDQLNSDDKNVIRGALDRLAKKLPAEPNPEIAAAIDQHAAHDDFWVRRSAVAALERWATEESAPAVIELLQDKDVFIRGSAIEIIRKYPSQDAADALGKLLADGFSRGKAAEVLMTFGELAREPALPHLKSSDFVTQMEACKVLGAVGTGDDLAALQSLAADNNGLVKNAATQAVADIGKRVKKK
jgi:hypothetical protein